MSQSGTIFDIKKYAIHDGPGIRTTIFLKGCSMACQWCHNPESKNIGIEKFIVKDCISKSTKNETVGYAISSDEVLNIIEKDHIFYDESGGGVTFSGGEPLLQPNFLLDLLRECKAQQIHTVVDTAGEASWGDFEKIRNYVDLFLFDLKIIDDDLHKKYTGVSNKRIHNNLEKLIENKNKIELRIPLIPNITDTASNIRDIIGFLNALKFIPVVTLLSYNPLSRDKFNRFGLENHLGKLSVQTEKELIDISEFFKNNGINATLNR